MNFSRKHRQNSTPERNQIITANLVRAIRESAGQPVGSPTSVVDEAEKAIYETYGFGESVLTGILTMCGLKRGQEAMLPSWFKSITTRKESMSLSDTVFLSRQHY
jgi:hypothetical protein